MAGRKLNSVYMLAGQIVGKAGLLGSVMIYSRLLSDARFGELLFAVAFSAILFCLADMGATLVTTRRLTSSADPRGVLSTALALRTGLTLLTLGILALFVSVMNYGAEQVRMLYVVYLGFILDGYCETFYAVFRAREKMFFEGLSRTLQGFFAVVLAVAAWKLNRGYLFASMAYPLRSLVPFIMSAAAAFRITGGGTVSSGLLAEARTLLRVSLPLSVLGLLMVAGQRFDSTIVKSALSDPAVAAWQQCYRIFEPLVLLVAPTLLPGALFPDLCRARMDSWAMVRTRITWMTDVFTSGAIVLLIPLFFFGTSSLGALWGPEYLRGQSPEDVLLTFRIMLFCLPLTYIFHIFLAVVLAGGRQKAVLPGILLAFAVQVTGLYLLIGRIGLPAAALMQLVFVSILSLWLGISTRRSGGPTGFLRGLKRPLLAALPFGVLAAFPVFSPLVLTVLSLAGFAAIWTVSGGGQTVLHPPRYSD